MAYDNGMSEKQLTAAYWFVTHKLLLKNILIVFLVVVNICLISLDLYLIINNLVLDREGYDKNLAGLINPNSDLVSLRQNKLPVDLLAGNVSTLANSQGFDIMAEIVNANAKWAAIFDYQFQLGGKLTAVKNSFILPNEKKMILNLAVKDGNLAEKVVLSNIKWTKVTDFDELSRERLLFEISNIKFVPSAELGLGEKIPVSRATFSVTNHSAYNFANVNFIIFLYSGSRLVGINQVVSGNFLSGKTMNLESTFFQTLPQIDKVQINPEVNIIDQNVFLKY